jgi:maltooligosyltrehalose trehalohydrolase
VVEGLEHGDRYRFVVDGDALADPASRWQPEGVHGPSAVVDDSVFRWHDDAWTGVELAETVLYEMHVGTFTAEGTFDAAIRHLPRLHELGITTIEVMPVAQFPGRRNWGYDGVFPYAVQQTYGGPDGPRPIRRRRPPVRPRRRPRRRLQPHGARGQRARPVRAVLHRLLSHAVG